MKKNRLIELLVVIPVFVLMGVMFTSCIDDSLNNSPNAVNEAKVKTPDGVKGLVIAMQVAFSDWYAGDRSRINSIWTWTMCAPNGLGRPQPVQWNTYTMTADGPSDDQWKTAYRGVKICNDIISYAPEVFASDAKTANTMVGMAKLFKAMAFGELAACFGSIPVVVEGLNPAKFVAQKDAYATVQTLLDEAITAFQAGGVSLNRDLNFAGDIVKWQAVAHTLKARFYLHMKDYANAKTQAGLGISDPAVAVIGQHSETVGEYSPWGHWCNTEVGEPIRAEKAFIDALQSEAGDKRLAQYFTPSTEAAGKFYGFAQHTKSTDTNDLKPSMVVTLKKYRGYADGLNMVSYQENLLIGAEAKARTGDVAGAVTDVNIIRKAAGLADFASADAAKTITEILKQKTLQLFLEGQVYHDMRRTGTMPEVVKGKNVRWMYPQSEKNSNPNVPPDDDALVKDLLP